MCNICNMLNGFWLHFGYIWTHINSFFYYPGGRAGLAPTISPEVAL